MFIVLKDGQPTGVAYFEESDKVREHHAQYGEKCIWIPGIQLEYDEEGNCTTTFTLEEYKSMKISEIQSWANSLLKTIEQGYTGPEVKTFNQQEAGATDIINGIFDSKNALYVQELANMRVQFGDYLLGSLNGNERYIAFAQRILNNSAQAATAILTIMAMQQGFEITARAATTIEQLNAIVLPTTLPDLQTP